MNLDDQNQLSVASTVSSDPNLRTNAVAKLMWTAIAALVIGLLVTNIDLRSQLNELKSASTSEVSVEKISLYEEPADLEKFIEKVSESIVTVWCGDYVGTGFAFDVAGIDEGFKTHIITNHHVIRDCTKDSSEFEVTYGGSKQYKTKAEIYGWDEENDLALIQIAAEVPVLAAAKDFSRSGEWTMAIGNPLEDENMLYNATTFGRMIALKDEKFNYTSAVINPGNSGGPLVNSHGEVIGVNTYGWVDQEKGLWNISVDSDALCAKILKCGE